MKHFSHKSQQGFSLIELSAILTLLAILAVSYLQWLQSSTTEDADYEAITQKKMEIIKQATIQFIHTHKRLPCPTDSTISEDHTLPSSVNTSYRFGWENTSYVASPDFKVCNSPIGTVPVYALGLDSHYAYDGWNRRFSFHVSPARCDSRTGDDIGCTAEDYANDGVIYDGTYFDLEITNNVNAFPRPVRAMFVITSHGPNGLGAYTAGGTALTLPNIASEADEYENANGHIESSSTLSHATYVVRSTQDGFDDIVSYVTKDQINKATHKYYPLTTAFCNANSTQLATLDANTIIQMNNNITDYAYTGKNLTPVNQGGEVVFDILWTLQNICADKSYYGEAVGPKWLGKLCPGGGTLGASSQCNCNDGDWDGSC